MTPILLKFRREDPKEEPEPITNWESLESPGSESSSLPRASNTISSRFLQRFRKASIGKSAYSQQETKPYDMGCPGNGLDFKHLPPVTGKSEEWDEFKSLYTDQEELQGAVPERSPPPPPPPLSVSPEDQGAPDSSTSNLPGPFANLYANVGEPGEWEEFANFFLSDNKPPDWDQLTNLFVKLGESTNAQEFSVTVEDPSRPASPIPVIPAPGSQDQDLVPQPAPTGPAFLRPADVWSIVSRETQRRSNYSADWCILASPFGTPSRLGTPATRLDTPLSRHATPLSRHDTSSSRLETSPSCQGTPASGNPTPAHATKIDQRLHSASRPLPKVPELFPLPGVATAGGMPATLLKNICISPQTIIVGHQVTFGGSCDLFVGCHSKHGKVALKRPRVSEDTLESGALRRFGREAEIWKNVSHTHCNILPFLGIVRKDNTLYLVSPWIEGHDLRTSLYRNQPMDKLVVLTEIAGAIVFLHSKGIVHGDINAKNILLGHNNEPLICDFGLAKIVADGMTTSANLKGVGSLRWMAPELFQDSPKTMASDVYAFGMTISEVLSGRSPYANVKDTGRIIFFVLSGIGKPSREPLRSPNGESYESLWTIAERCWAWNAVQRPTMIETYAALSIAVVTRSQH